MIFISNYTQEDSFWEQVKPYSWSAKGNQLRMKGIYLGLLSLKDRHEKFGSFIVRSRINGNTVFVRINRKESPKDPVLAASFKPAKLVLQRGILGNCYVTAARAFFFTASGTLSDADPRWSSMRIRVSPIPRSHVTERKIYKGWESVLIESEGKMEFGLRRDVLVGPTGIYQNPNYLFH
jgi:hypothetical protein